MSTSKKKKLITTNEAAQALQWLEHFSLDAELPNDRKQAMVIRGLILGLQRCLEVQEQEISIALKLAQAATTLGPGKQLGFEAVAKRAADNAAKTHRVNRK